MYNEIETACGSMVGLHASGSRRKGGLTLDRLVWVGQASLRSMSLYVAHHEQLPLQVLHFLPPIDTGLPINKIENQILGQASEVSKAFFSLQDWQVVFCCRSNLQNQQPPSVVVGSILSRP